MTNLTPDTPAPKHLITIKADAEFDNADLALQHADASGRGEPILVGGRYYVAAKAECDRLAAAGVPFAYVYLHDMPDGTDRVVTVPVN